MAQATDKGVVHSVASKHEYESLTILRPSTGKPEISALIERMSSTSVEHGARLLKVRNDGTRVLASPVRDERKGIYIYWRYLGGSDFVAEFERLLGRTPYVIQFSTVKIGDNVDS